ncbi:MAG TPA: MMPL family transporter [Thermoleophilaceae bacterium]|nr:MMPL family transporter [Thermoleophilaceae bacterium]
MNRLLDVTLRRRRAVLAVWGLLFVVGGFFAAGLNDKIVPGGIAPDTSESQQVADELERASTSRTLFALLEWDEPLPPAQLRRRTRELTSAVRQIEGVVAVTPVRAGRAGGRPSGRVAAIRIASRGDVDGSIEVAKRLHADRDELTPRGAELLLGGLGAYNRELTELTRSDLARAERVGLPIVFVILLLTFGSLWAALVPLAIALPAVVIGLGGVGLLASGIDVSEYVTNASTMIGVALGVDYAMFLVQRLREQLASGAEVEEAIRAAMSTTGVAVLWSGATVIAAEATLLLVDARAIRSAAVGMMLVTFFATASAIVLGPVVFSLMGRRLVRASFRRAAAAPTAESPRWTRWATRVVGRAPLWLALSAVVMVALAIPTKDLHDSVDVQSTAVLPEDSNVRRAYEIAAREFGPGAMTPVVVVARDGPDGAQRIVRELRGDERVAAVGRPVPLGANGPFALDVVSRHGPYEEGTRDLVASLREGALERRLAGVSYAVGGETGATIDTKKEMFDRLPTIVGLLVVMVSLLLLFAFRSVFLALKAALLVVLTLAASLGALLLITQSDFGANLIGVGDPIDIHPLVPLTIVAIVMALTTDYEVLLLSRVAERYRQTRDNQASIVFGMARTGRVITSAAAIMIAVFFGFALADLPTLKYLGIGLAISVFLDATIVRGVMVPAVMQLMGALNWWRPTLRTRSPKAAPPAP